MEMRDDLNGADAAKEIKAGAIHGCAQLPITAEEQPFAGLVIDVNGPDFPCDVCFRVHGSGIVDEAPIDAGTATGYCSRRARVVTDLGGAGDAFEIGQESGAIHRAVGDDLLAVANELRLLVVRRIGEESDHGAQEIGVACGEVGDVEGDVAHKGEII